MSNDVSVVAEERPPREAAAGWFRRSMRAMQEAPSAEIRIDLMTAHLDQLSACIQALKAEIDWVEFSGGG